MFAIFFKDEHRDFVSDFLVSVGAKVHRRCLGSGGGGILLGWVFEYHGDLSLIWGPLTEIAEEGTLYSLPEHLPKDVAVLQDLRCYIRVVQETALQFAHLR